METVNVLDTFAQICDEENREWGISWKMMYGQERGFLWKDRVEASLSCWEKWCIKEQIYAEEKGDNHRSDVLEKGWVYKQVQWLVLEVQTSSARGGVAEYVGTDVGRRWHWKEEDEIDLFWLHLLPVLYLYSKAWLSVESMWWEENVKYKGVNVNEERPKSF